MLGIPTGHAKIHIGPELVTAVRCERIHTKDWAKMRHSSVRGNIRIRFYCRHLRHNLGHNRL